MSGLDAIEVFVALTNSGRIRAHDSLTLVKRKSPTIHTAEHRVGIHLSPVLIAKLYVGVGC